MTHPAYRKATFPFWFSLVIRFRDLDPLNHVNNAIFSTFYEEARIAFIAEVPAFKSRIGDGFSFVLANINIDFIGPVEYPQELLIGTGIEKIGKTSISSFQAIYTGDEKKLISTAEAHGVWFNLAKKKPANVPEIENMSRFIIE